MLVVIGAPGADDYESMFEECAAKWRAAGKQGAVQFTAIGDGERAGTADRDRLREWLAQSHDVDLVWVVLIGHGTHDGKTAKFNLRGPDITAEEFAGWISPIKTPLVVINGASASAPFINAASAKGRVIVTATKSGDEINFARFGQYMAEAIGDARSDLDKDDQVSLLEAYLTACRNVADFYKSERRLATEHALLDDNGDGLGTPAEWFRGVRAVQRAKEGAALDGVRAHQIHLVASDRESRMPAEVRKRRDELELAIAALREEKDRLNVDEYYRRLDALMVQLAELYDAHSPASSR